MGEPSGERWDGTGTLDVSQQNNQYISYSDVTHVFTSHRAVQLHRAPTVRTNLCHGLLGCARGQRVLTGTQELTRSGIHFSGRRDGAGRQGAALGEIPPARAPPTALPRQGHRVTRAPSRARRVPGQQPRYPGRRGVTATPGQPGRSLPPPGVRLDPPKHHGSAPDTPGPQRALAPQHLFPPFPGAPGRAP